MVKSFLFQVGRTPSAALEVITTIGAVELRVRSEVVIFCHRQAIAQKFLGKANLVGEDHFVPFSKRNQAALADMSFLSSSRAVAIMGPLLLSSRDAAGQRVHHS
jgi:hypothetical protein